MTQDTKKLGTSSGQRKNGQTSRAQLTEHVPAAAFLNCDGLAAVDVAQSGEVSEAMVSSCGADEGRVGRATRSSPLRCSDCTDLVHELSNVMTGVMVNAQLLDWRLPPYSRLKRPIHEMERNAQRARELLKALLRRLGDNLPTS
ncbi:MAG: hypothetical protein WA655_13835 [Candidatus Korobacteraceae bacterium]